ncbi:MAG: hypothetical protein JNK82_02270 [Myxococcaceae bacterium]|nr:hypothetical protein [Myxococcaceae bacterium]
MLANGPLERLRAGDPVQRTIAAAFVRAGVGVERDARAIESPELDRDQQFAVLRVLEGVMTLAPHATIDAFEAFANHGRPLPSPKPRPQAEVGSVVELEQALLALPTPATERVHTGTRVLSQALFRAAAPLGLPAVARAIAVTQDRWPETTDASSTNRYCCLAAVAFIDQRAFAIAEAVNPRKDAPR